MAPKNRNGCKNHTSRNLLDMAPIPNDTLLPKVYWVMSGQFSKVPEV